MLLFHYFVALLAHALLEREVRRGMACEKLGRLPLQRHRLRRKGRLVQLPTALFKASR